MSDPENIHATALAFGERGLLVMGATGSGKTTLALTLISQARREGRFARLVSDDRVWVSAAGGRIVGRAPETIAGLVELRGLGPRPVEHLGALVVDAVVRLVPAADAQRLPDPETIEIGGSSLPLLKLKERNAGAAARAVTAWLGRAPFLPSAADAG